MAFAEQYPHNEEPKSVIKRDCSTFGESWISQDKVNR